MSTKSSSKFWKKFGLGKKTSSTQVNRPASIQSQNAITTPTPRNNEDNRSVRNKRFSGVFLQRRQSINSVKRLCQFSSQNTPPSPNELESKQAPGAAHSTSPLPPLPPPSQSALEYQNYQPNHVESTTAPLNSDLGIQQDEDSDNTFDVITYDEAQTDEQPSLAAQEHVHTKVDYTKHTNDAATRLIQPKSVHDLKKAPQSSSSSSSFSSTTSSSHLPKQQQLQSSKSRLRPPTSTKSRTATGSIKSSTSSLQKETNTSSLPAPSTSSSSSTTSDAPIPSHLNGANASHEEKDRLIQRLQEALQTEQSVNQALQGQKEAITRDLDYFSLTVDELTEEKESLVQKYEEEKLKCQSKDQDLNELLDKLKSSTDNARERSKEVDQWKAEIEKIKEDASLEQEKLKAVLKQKDEEISRLKEETIKGRQEIKGLSSRLDQLAQEALHQKATSQSHSPTTIETPGASPQLDAQQYIPNDDLQLQHNDTSQPQQQQPVKTTGSRIAVQKRVYPASTTTTSSNNSLDNELLSLTKEKEKLQSDYSKIPLSGGGHSSRRRKEHLEEMLDEVDSQLSKVKQKIRRS